MVASTGLIGRLYPIERLRAHLAGAVPVVGPADLPAVARAIMTTDTVPKLAGIRVGPATIAGVAKGVGMIEPDMATMLTYLVTDADVPAGPLRAIFRRVVDRTFNCLSVDTDTSTSDTAVLLANGAAGPVDPDAFEEALFAVAHSLVRQLARDAEGATKLIQVDVTEGRDEAQAKRVAKAVVNSPLVKTAVHGADPNWGRVVMAVGKCSEDTDITPESVRVAFGAVEVYPGVPDDKELDEVADLLRADEVHIGVSLGTGTAGATVWGCDLSDGYVRINADYTT
jgi:glutamate N-acetyltransferase/amino-acid N-acetyltransferase